jgi:hypothetical protein
MSNLENALRELRQKRNGMQKELEKLEQIITGIESLNGMEVPSNIAQPKRMVSAASRRKMALAQKARWAKKTTALPLPTVKPKRVISAAGKKRIAAAARAPWAKIRAAKKTA